MKKAWQGCAVVGAFIVAVGAGAQEKKPTEKATEKTMEKPAAGGEEMAPPKPGPETMALKPLATPLAMSGKMPAGAMAPNAPETPTKGTHSCKWTADKLWLQCEIKDTMGSGKQAQTWMGHMMVGWDFSAKAYRAQVTDNFGMAMMMQGKAEGSKIPFESVGDYHMMGKPMKMRFTIDLTDPKEIKFTDERDMGKTGKWMVFEEGTMKPGK